MEALGLPRLENGRYDQALLRNTVGVLAPVGTCKRGPEGHLLGRGPRTDSTTFSITRKRADGDQSSSYEKVLVGTVDAGDSG